MIGSAGLRAAEVIGTGVGRAGLEAVRNVDVVMTTRLRTARVKETSVNYDGLRTSLRARKGVKGSARLRTTRQEAKRVVGWERLRTVTALRRVKGAQGLGAARVVTRQVSSADRTRAARLLTGRAKGNACLDAPRYVKQAGRERNTATVPLNVSELPP